MLDAISRVRRSPVVMKAERKVLGVLQQLRAKIPDQFFSGIGLQPPTRQVLQTREQANGKQQADCKYKRTC